MRKERRIAGVEPLQVGRFRFDSEDGFSWVDGEPRLVIVNEMTVDQRDEDVASLTLEQAKPLARWLAAAIKRMDSKRD